MARRWALFRLQKSILSRATPANLILNAAYSLFVSPSKACAPWILSVACGVTASQSQMAKRVIFASTSHLDQPSSAIHIKYARKTSTIYSGLCLLGIPDVLKDRKRVRENWLVVCSQFAVRPSQWHRAMCISQLVSPSLQCPYTWPCFGAHAFGMSGLNSKIISQEPCQKSTDCRALLNLWCNTPTRAFTARKLVRLVSMLKSKQTNSQLYLGPDDRA